MRGDISNNGFLALVMDKKEAEGLIVALSQINLLSAVNPQHYASCKTALAHLRKYKDTLDGINMDTFAGLHDEC